MAEYPAAVQEKLGAARASAGDRVRVAGERMYEGVVMPHTEFSGDDILILKLETGYNVGVPVSEISTIEVLERSKAQTSKRALPPPKAALPMAAVLGTGGTIASYVDYRTGAVHPAVTTEDLVFSVPELLDVCNVRARVLYSVFSENLNARHWQELAVEAAKELNTGAAAVLIPHGTDTLSFTAAALAFMLRNLPGPVILVGSQRSSDRPSSDAAFNLLCAARLAAEDFGEVVSCLHHETGDNSCAILRGTKIRKMHASRRDAFRAMNEKPLGLVHADGRVTWSAPAGPRKRGTAVAETGMDTEVAYVTFHPGLTAKRFEAQTDDAHGIVIAGTGLGHVSDELVMPVRRAVHKGKPVVMTTQCLNGRVGLRVYDKGRDLLAAGVIPGEDMLPEVALVKLMWVLGRTTEPTEVRELMTTNLAGEINPAITLDEYVF